MLTGAQIYQSDFASDVTCVHFSPDGCLITSSSKDHLVRLWNGTLGTCLATLEGHSAAVTGVVFSADGRRIFSSSEDETVVVWDVEKRAPLMVLRGHDSSVQCVAASKNGKHVASGSDEDIRVWNAVTGAHFKTLECAARVLSVSFSQDSNRVFFALYDRTIQAWNITTDLEPQHLFDGRWCVAVSPDGRFIAAPYFHSIKLRDLLLGQVQTATDHHSRVVLCSPDSRWIASTSGSSITLWDKNITYHALSLEDNFGEVTSMAFSPDNRRIAYCSEDGAAFLWDMPGTRAYTTGQGQKPKLLAHGSSARVVSVAFAPDATCVALACEDSSVHLWDMTAEKVTRTLQRLKERSDPEGIFVSFSPINACILSAVAGWEGSKISVWDPTTVEEPCTLSANQRIYVVGFTANGHYVIIQGDLDGHFRFWDMVSGTQYEDMPKYAAICSQSSPAFYSAPSIQEILLREDTSYTNIESIHSPMNDVAHPTRTGHYAVSVISCCQSSHCNP